MADVSGFVPQPSDLTEEADADSAGMDLEPFFASLASVEAVRRVFGDLEQSEQEVTPRD